jgi:hypothetical protein
MFNATSTHAQLFDAIGCSPGIYLVVSASFVWGNHLRTSEIPMQRLIFRQMGHLVSPTSFPEKEV